MAPRALRHVAHRDLQWNQLTDNWQGFCSLHTTITSCETSNQRTSADVVSGDRAALVDLYNAAGGAWWRNAAGNHWNTAAGVCTWTGVTCSGDGRRVTQLCVAAARGPPRGMRCC